VPDQEDTAKRYATYQTNLKDARDWGSEWSNEADEARDFIAGKQYDEREITDLQREQRPALVVNQYGQIVRVVSGSEITNRFEPHCLPRTPEDQGGVDVFNELIRFHRNECDAAHEESLAFEECANTGVGATETRISYLEDPNGRVVTDRVPNEQLAWDPSAVKRNVTDGRFVIRGKYMDQDEFVQRWPDKADSYMAALSGGKDLPFSRAEADPVDVRRSWMYKSGVKSYDRERGRVLIMEHQYWHREYGFVVVNPMDQTLQFVDRQQAGEMMQQAQAEQAPLIFREYRKRFKREFWAGPVELEYGDCPINRFTYNFLTAFEDRRKEYTQWYGMYRIAKDPQMWANRFLSQIVHIIGTNPKGSVHAEQDAFVNASKARQDWSRPNAMILYRPGALKEKKVMIVDPPRLPDAAFQMAQFALEALPKILGVNPYMGGSVEDLKRTPAASIQALIRQGMVSLAPLFDSLRLYRKDIGRTYLEFIQRYIRPGVMVRVVGSRPAKFVQYTQDQSFMNYDVVVEEAPMQPTNMMELWQTLTEQGLLQSLLEMGMPVPPSLLDIIPGLPAHIKEEWQQQIVDMQQQAAQAQQMPQAPVQ
jgi:hypothetical protein